MSYSGLTAESDSVKGSSRSGTAWGLTVIITGMLAIMAPFTSGDAIGDAIEEVGEELERV